MGMSCIVCAAVSHKNITIESTKNIFIVFTIRFLFIDEFFIYLYRRRKDTFFIFKNKKTVNNIVQLLKKKNKSFDFKHNHVIKIRKYCGRYLRLVHLDPLKINMANIITY